MADEKTEKATPKRKQDARKKGQIFLSQELVTLATLLAAFYGFAAFSTALMTKTEAMIREGIAQGAETEALTPHTVTQLFSKGFLVLAQTALPVLMIVCLVAIVVTMGQTRLYFSGQGFAFKGERINPLSGFKKMFSMRGAVELLKSLLKISILGWVIYSILKTEIPQMTRLYDMSVENALEQTGSIVMSIVKKTVIAFAFVGGADYFYQWWEYEKNLRMSKQEIKDEFKQMEGDPQIKGRQRSIAQQRARRRMMQQVPQADVVIRNPTHYAIAVQYDRKADRAPRVVAKGADQLALRIVKVAEENGVYITENKPLARALFEAVEVDAEIPEKFYQPIAQLLAFVYNLKKTRQET